MRTRLLIIFGALAVLLAAGAGPAPSVFAAKRAQGGSGDGMPQSIISLQSPYCILVEKESQKLMLYQRNGNGIELIKEYTCSTGQNHGDKLKSGDKKTPEGVYYFKKIYNDHQLPSRYGVMAFVLDFPNYLDRVEEKGGNGIWLHGLDRPLVPYDSKGCIALVNEDILEVSTYITLFDTPIIIEENITRNGTDGPDDVREEVLGFLASWEAAWENKHFDSYVDCYSRSLFKRGRFARWKSHKQRLTRTYKFIDVNLSDINVFRHDDTYIISFYQDYESDTFSSSGLKKLYLQRNSADLRIIGEDWAGTSRPKKGRQPQVPSEERNLKRMLNNWVTAWEKKNISGYMQCYSKDFFSQNMDWRQWRSYKDDINRNNIMIKVSVLRPSVAITGGRAEVSYVQQYRSDSYTDYGLKRLKLRKEDDGWKIVAESWEPI